MAGGSFAASCAERIREPRPSAGAKIKGCRAAALLLWDYLSVGTPKPMFQMSVSQ